MTRPSETILLCETGTDCSDAASTPEYNRARGGGYYMARWGIGMRPNSIAPYPAHNELANVAFCDGHTKALKVSSFGYVWNDPTEGTAHPTLNKTPDLWTPNKP